MLNVWMLAVCLCLFAFAAAGWVARTRRCQFAYDVRRDYEYDNLKPYAQVVVRDGMLQLPEGISGEDTVLVALNIRCTWLGNWRLPYLEWQTAQGVRRFFVEHGARGRRYVNISHSAAAGGEIRLHGRDVLLPEQQADIFVFPKQDLDGRKILVLAPHADDAELAAYGLYEQYADDAFVLTLTASEGGAFHYANLYRPEEAQAQYLQKGLMRVWNSLSVPRLAGVPSENIAQLGFFDGTLAQMYQNPQAEIRSTKLADTCLSVFRRANTAPVAAQFGGGSRWCDLVDNIGKVISHFQPDIIVCPSPNIDAHPDHQMTSLAVFEALRQLDYRKGKLFLHTLHYLTDDYPIGRPGAVLSLPPKFAQPFYFESVYSHPLCRDTMRRKFLALDAMNDIRPNADCYLKWQAMLFRGFNTFRHKILHIDKDLISRFVRSNELFYVVPVSRVHDDEIYRQLSRRG